MCILRQPTNQINLEWTTEAVSSDTLYYRLLVDGQEVYGGHIVINK